MADTPMTPPTRRQALIARGEQWVLVILALVLVAGVAWRGITYYRLGAEPLEVIPAAPPTYRVDVNTADWLTLAVVPGLGEALSKRIIDLRDRRRGLKSLEELKEVRGISDKTLAKLRPYLFIGNGVRADGEAVQMVDPPPGPGAREQSRDAGNYPAGN